MLMDLFYNTLPARITRKRRVHFHAFMIDVHKRLHAMKAKLGHEGGDAVAPVARDLANEAIVLCFDEFQVQFSHLTHVLFNECATDWVRRVTGYGYCRRYDPSEITGGAIESWRCVCYYFKVSFLSYSAI